MYAYLWLSITYHLIQWSIFKHVLRMKVPTFFENKSNYIAMLIYGASFDRLYLESHLTNLKRFSNSFEWIISNLHYFSENICYIIWWNMKGLKKYFSNSPSEFRWIVWGCFWKFRLQSYLYSLFLNNILQIRPETGPSLDILLCEILGANWKEW